MNLQTITKNLPLYVIVLSILWLTGQAATEVQARTSQDQSSKMMTDVSETATRADQVDGAETIDPAYQSGGPYQMFFPIIKNNKCAHTIGLDESKADGRDEYSTVSPGDTVCIEGGMRNDDLKLKNFHGTPERPIKFMNIGSQVVIDSNNTHGIIIQNSQYFQLTGTGSGDTYGIKIIGSQGSGLRIGWKSEYFEIDHIEVTGVSGSGIAAQTKGVCLDGSSNDYDYDNDGKYKNDKDDVVNQDNFTQRNSIFHHNYVHNVGTEGFYIGSSSYGREDKQSCDNGKETIYEPVLHEVHLYENLIEETGWDGLQVGSAIEACTIHHNRIHRDSQAQENGQQSGIMNNPGSVCDIYNNFIKDSSDRGIHVQGNGGNKIYNNIIVNPGRNSSASGINIGRENNNGNLVIVNNTVINPSNHGIDYHNEMGDNNIIENNITVNPGAGIFEAILLDSENGVVSSNNFATMDINEVGFVDPDADNYTLQDSSLAIDAGKPQVITIDFNNAPRPQGEGFDIGATER